jgi:hypothetical protein
MYYKNMKKNTILKKRKTIRKKTKKLNKYYKKHISGGNPDTAADIFYNKNFLSLDFNILQEKIENFNSTSSSIKFARPKLIIQFIKEYIQNLNSELSVPVDNTYKKYRDYYGKLKTKFNDIQQKKNNNKEKPEKEVLKAPNLQEIRLNYYLKSVYWIISKNQINHSKVKFNLIFPYSIYHMIDDMMKTYYKKEIKKEEKNTYIECHGGYDEKPNLVVVPENVRIHFITPFNYDKLMTCYFNASEILSILQKEAYDSKNPKKFESTMNNLLKNKNFKDMTTFFPGQKYLDIILQIRKGDLSKSQLSHHGIYNLLSDSESTKEDFNELEEYLSVILRERTFPPNTITNIYIDCCRGLNQQMESLDVELMYIYENFMKQFNHFLLSIKPKQKIDIAEINKINFPNNRGFYYTKKKLFNVSNEAGFNKELSPIQYKFTHTVEKLITYLKSENGDFQNNISKLQKYEVRDIILYLEGGNKNISSLLTKILDNLKNNNDKINFISKILEVSIKNEYIDFVKQVMSVVPEELMFESILSYDNKTLIDVIFKIKNIEMFKLVLSYDKIDVNMINDKGQTRLHYIVLIILHSVVNVLEQKKLFELLDHLLKHEKINMNAKDNEGMTALHYVFLPDDNYNNVYNDDILVKLSSDKKIDMTVKDKKGKTALHYAIVSANNIEDRLEQILEYINTNNKKIDQDDIKNLNTYLIKYKSKYDDLYISENFVKIAEAVLEKNK